MDIYTSLSARSTDDYRARVEYRDGKPPSIHLHPHDVHGTYIAVDEAGARHLIGVLVEALEELTAFLNSEQAQEEAVF